MSEQILKAIIQLLAIVAREDDVTLDEKASIANFLVDNVTVDDAEKFLALFEELIEGYASYTESDCKNEITKICEQINADQTSKQKMILLLHLIELIAADGTITTRENELVYFITDKINIKSKITDLIKAFVIYQDRSKIISSNILIVDNGTFDIPDRCKHYHSPNLSGFIFILRIPELDVYFAKYIGEDVIIMNGSQMRHNHIYIFTTGSVIKTEHNESIFHSDIVAKFLETTYESKISLVAEKVGFKFKNGKVGLRDINISENGGKLIAIMGGSGAGKSTLLNVLNGAETPNTGVIRVNGIDLHQNKKELEGVIGYIPQDDLLMEELTVFENLFFAAKLCFKDKNNEELKELTDQTIESLGLVDARDLKVGSPLDKSISGGQRKRVNIGLELLREPSILFVDEPTSGLSSRDSENIMDLLKDLSHKGKMIFTVIHQPSEEIFKMFDKLILLDVGGYQIYYGNPVVAISYFKGIVNMLGRKLTANPEQIFNIVESKVVNEYGNLTKQRKNSPEKWYREFKNRIKIPEIEEVKDLPKKTLRIPNRLRQFAIFTHRDVLSKLSNKQYLFINSLEAPFLAVLLAFIIRYIPDDTSSYSFRENENIPVFFFMSVIVALFMGLTVSAEEIIRDRKILKREEFLNLSRISYISSKMLILFFISAIQTLSYVLIGNWILDIEGMTLTSWLILFSVSCFANLLGLNISSALKSAVTVYILIPLLIIPQLILSGIVVNFDKLHPSISNEEHVPFVGEIMASRWAYEALAVNQFRDNKFEKQFYSHDQTIAQSEYKNVYYIPKLMSELDFIRVNFSNQKAHEEVAYKLQTVKNEIKKELIPIGKDKFPEVENLTPEGYNSVLHGKTVKFLEKLRAYYNIKMKKSNQAKEDIINKYLQQPNGREQFVLLRDEHENEAISILVKNTATENRILEHKNELIQKIYPIFHDPKYPDHALDFRAHFYAPTKHFFGKLFNTVYFNVAAIWIMVLILVITLYYDLLKRFLKVFSKKR